MLAWFKRLLAKLTRKQTGNIEMGIKGDVEFTSLSGVITCGQCGKQTDLGVIAYDHCDPAQQAKALEENPNLTRTEPYRKLCGCP